MRVAVAAPRRKVARELPVLTLGADGTLSVTVPAEGSLLPPGTYRWQVVAELEDGREAPSERALFRIP